LSESIAASELLKFDFGSHLVKTLHEFRVGNLLCCATMGGFRALMVCDFHRDSGVLEMFVEDVGISKKVVCLFFFVMFGFVEGDFFNGSYHDKLPLNHCIFGKISCFSPTNLSKSTVSDSLWSFSPTGA